MPYVNIADSTVSVGVGLLVGKALGLLQVKMNSEVNRLQEEVLQSCGNNAKLLRLASKVGGMMGILQLHKARMDKINKITQPLKKIETALTVFILVLKNISIPGNLTTVGLNVKYSDQLHTLKEIKKQVSDQREAIEHLISSNNTGILTVISRLQVILTQIDAVIKECLDTGVLLEQPISQSDLVNNLDDISITEELKYYTDYTGQVFTLEVITVDTSEVAPLRQGIAKDRQGIIRYKSEKSFSSSTKVLLDEVKFRIENNIIT